MNVYLAGGLRSGWQDKIKNMLPGIIFTSPLDKDDKIMNVDEYGVWDLHYIKQCDIVFAYAEKTNPSGIGLACEIGYAYGIGKTVILCLEDNNEFHKDRYMQFLKKVSNITFNNFDLAVKYLKNFR